jgi:hypothetical protein
MNGGIRAELRIDAPGDCPIARVSSAAGSSAYSISKGIDPEAPDRVTEEFTIDAEGSLDAIERGGEAMARVFSYGSRDVYRFSRTSGRGCACERIEGFDCPVVDVHARDGSLYLVFHAPDIETLREVVAELRGAYPGLDVRRLLRSREDHAGGDLVFVDRSELTERQREVLETAHSMGYFEHHKGANAGEVAEALGITTSTFTEHLAAAQTKLLGSIRES